MANAKQLPSGSWRVRIYDKDLKKQVSFTSQLEGKAGKAEAELMAREYQLGRKKKLEKGKTLGECIDEYIALKENVLSPTTIAGYRSCRNTLITPICDIYLSELTPQDVQKFVNKLSLSNKPKTVINAHGLISATLNVFAPDLRLKTTLPKVQKKIKQLPPVEQVMKAVIGSTIELPCLLAMWCSLRMSEIRGIKKSDVKDGVLTICRTKVRVEGEDIVKNSTKTIESTRRIALPQRIIDLIEAASDESEYLVPIAGEALYQRFQRLLKRNGIDKMSFHELRHMNASVMLALGVPDKYAMERGGWSTPAVLKSVYQHTFSAERNAVDKKIDSYFNSILDTILDTDSE